MTKPLWFDPSLLESYGIIVSTHGEADNADEVPLRTDYGSRPGKPSWGPLMDSKRAKAHEAQLLLVDPIGALEWDRRADARQAAWENGPFAKAVDRLDIHPGQLDVA